jgi:hypothetical protein
MEEESALVDTFMKLDDRCKEKKLAFSHTLRRRAAWNAHPNGEGSE